MKIIKRGSNQTLTNLIKKVLSFGKLLGKLIVDDKNITINRKVTT